MDASPYFAPMYFAASFFAPLAAVVPAAPASIGPYFAPSYFAPAFFAGAASAPAPTTPVGTSPSSGTTPDPLQPSDPVKPVSPPSTPVSGQAGPYFATSYFATSYFAADTPSLPVASQYFAPSYFAPAFFAGPAAPVEPGPPVPAPPMEPVAVPGQAGPYFAPTFFTPTYFAVLASSPTAVTPPVVPPANGQVQDAFGVLVGLLQGTGVFEDVIFGDPSCRGRAGAGRHPLALVSPRGWEDSDDYDPTSIIRRVTFAVRVVVRADDEAEPYCQLYRLTSAVEGVVDRADLGVPCLPALTRIRAGRHDQAIHYPELAIELEGEFSMLQDLVVPPSALA